jgi:hypothetical protein
MSFSTANSPYHLQFERKAGDPALWWMNSRMAWSYERFALAVVKLFETADFDCSRSGNLGTVFGTRLRLLFVIGSGLQCRSEKREPVPRSSDQQGFYRYRLRTKVTMTCK